MSYYEDIGVARTATAAEIREQYRVLVRLFHPDQFSEPALKMAAEGQLRRFNEIAAVLNNPDRRRSYDQAELQGRPQPMPLRTAPQQRSLKRSASSLAAWCIAGLACAGAILAVNSREPVSPLALQTLPGRTIVSNTPSPQPNSRQWLTPEAAARAAREAKENWRTRAYEAMAERDFALRELTRLRHETALTARYSSAMPLDPSVAMPGGLCGPRTDLPAVTDYPPLRQNK